MAKTPARKADGKPDNVQVLVDLHKAGAIDLAVANYSEVREAAGKEGHELPERGGRILGSARERLGLANPTARPKGGRAKPGRKVGKVRRARGKAVGGDDNVSYVMSLHEHGKLNLGKASYAEVVAAAKGEGVKLPERGGRILGSARQRLGLASGTKPAGGARRGGRAPGRKGPGRPAAGAASASGGRVAEARTWMEEEAQQAMTAGDYGKAELALMILRAL